MFTGQIDAETVAVGSRRLPRGHGHRAAGGRSSASSTAPAGGREAVDDWLVRRGTVGKTAVAGTKDRETNQISAAVVPETTKRELQALAFDRIAE